jgi:hypothetical protein
LTHTCKGLTSSVFLACFRWRILNSGILLYGCASNHHYLFPSCATASTDATFKPGIKVVVQPGDAVLNRRLMDRRPSIVKTAINTALFSLRTLGAFSQAKMIDYFLVRRLPLMQAELSCFPVWMGWARGRALRLYFRTSYEVMALYGTSEECD